MKKAVLSYRFLLLCLLVAMSQLAMAQPDKNFEFKVQYLESPALTWGIYVRPIAGFPIGANETVTSSGQLTVLLRNNGIDAIQNIKSVNGIWRENSDKTVGPIEAPTISYFYIGLSDEGSGIPLEDGKETLLCTFQSNHCLDTIGLIDNTTDPFAIVNNSVSNNSGMDLRVFNSSTGGIHLWKGNYAPLAHSCKDCDEDGIADGLEDTNGDGVFTPGIDVSNLCNVDNNELDTPPAPNFAQKNCITINGVTSNSPSGCGKTDGSITIDAVHETGNPLQYSIDGGRVWHNTSTLENLESGVTYNLELRDFLGLCFASYGRIELDAPAAAKVTTLEVSPADCNQNTGKIRIQATNLIATTVLQYSIDNGTTWVDNIGDFQNLAPGTYTPQIRAANGGLCIDRIDPIIIEEDCPTDPCIVTPFAIKNYPDQTICSGSATQITITEGTTYSWSPADGLNATDIATPTASPNNTTTYTVLVTNADGCTASDEITIIVANNPITDAGEDQDICAGESTTLEASGEGEYAWSPIEDLDNPAIAAPEASPAQTTTYCVTITDSNGCTAEDCVTVTVDEECEDDGFGEVTDVRNTYNHCESNSILTISGSEFLCPNDQVQLTVTGGVSWEWSPTEGLSDPTIANPIATPATTTTYTVVVMDANGCATYHQVTLYSGEVTTFLRTYGSTGDDVAYAGLISKDGNYVAIGYTTLDNGDKQAAISKIDPVGNSLWTKNFGGAAADKLENIVQLPTNEYIVLGETVSEGAGDADLFLTKLDNNGNIIWSKTYGAASADGAGYLILSKDNTLIFGGYTDRQATGQRSIFLSKVDFDGNTIWSKTIGEDKANSWLGSFGIDQNPKGNYVITGTWEAEQIPTKRNSFLMELSPDGEILFSRIYGGEQDDDFLSCIENKTAYLVGSSNSWNGDQIAIWSTEINTMGTITQSHTYSLPNKDLKPANILLYPSNELVVAGFEATTSASANSYLMKLSNTGEVLWAKSYGGSGMDRIMDVKEIATGYVLFGYSDSYGQGGKDMMVIKTNKEGIVEGCSTPIDIIKTVVAPTMLSPKPSTTDLPTGSSANFPIENENFQTAEQCSNLLTATPSISMVEAVTICLDESVELNEEAGTTSTNDSYAWSPVGGLNDPTIANPTASPTQTTVYCVTVTNASGCTASACRKVEVDEACEGGDFGEGSGSGNTINPCIIGVVVVACPDKYMCINDQVQLVVNGGVRWEWSPAIGLDDPTSAIPMASPAETTTYTVTGWDAEGCSATDEVIVNVIISGNCDLAPTSCQDDSLLEEDKVCIDENATIAEICLPYRVEDLNVTYTIELANTTEAPKVVHGCNFEKVYGYQYNFLPEAGQGGDYKIKDWTINNTIQTGLVSSMEELATFMQMVDPTGNWAMDPSRFSIIGGDLSMEYGDLTITQSATTIETILKINTTHIPIGTLLEIDMTGKEREVFTLIDLVTGCTDQVLIERCP